MSRPHPDSATQLSAFRHMRQRGALLSVMLLLVFAQSLLPIQSHTRWVQSADGRLIEMCTLQGIVVVDAADNGDLGDTAPSRSAAMSFSDLLTSAATGVPEAQPAWVALIATEFPPQITSTPTRQGVQQRPIRAPPVPA